MADNITLNSGTGGAVVATDDDGVAHHQYVKLEFGADNTQTKVDGSNPLPVTVTDAPTRDLGKVDIAMGQVAHDAVATSSDPVLAGGYASAAAPSDVSLDGDAVRSWHLRNGAQAVNLTAAGALIPGNATDGLLVNLGANNDVTVTGTVTVSSAPSTAVTNAGTFVVQENGAALTALQVIDNPVVVDDAAFTPATTSVMMAGFTFDDVTPDSVNEGDAGAARMSANRNVYVTIRDGAGNERGMAVDASGFLTANINGTVTVGSHAVTNAGTFAVQESGAALTALQLIDDTIVTLGTTTYTEAATKGSVIGAIRRDADTTLVDTTNEAAPLQVDARGCLKVEAFSGETLPVSLASVPSHAVTNAGTFAVQVDGTALTALQKIDDPVLVDDAAFTPATSSVSMAGFQADETATDSVDEGDAGAARMTLDRKVITTPQPHTTGGCSIFRSLDLDETEEDIKTAAGQVYGMWVTNTSTSTRFIKFYNATAANVIVGTTTPVITIGIPGNSSDDIAGLFSSTMGIAFDTAICAAATTGIADADTGAPGVNDVLINVFYK